MNIITMKGRTELKGAEAEQFRLEASVALKVSQHFAEQEREAEREKRRPVDVQDRPSVKRAMAAVEAAIVDAVWTLHRLPGGGSTKSSCGIAYVQEDADRWGLAVEKGWEAPMPKPSRPSPRSIDAMYAPLEWLSYLPRDQAMLVSTAAGTKFGNVKRRVAWARVRKSLPQTAGQTIRTLQRRYEGGIREIVARLTERAIHEKI